MALRSQRPRVLRRRLHFTPGGDPASLTLQATLELGGPKESLTGEQFAA